MTPEGKIKAKVKAYLDSIGAYYFMPVQVGYGKRTLDFLVCWRGEFWAIETKAPGKKLSAFQERIRKEINAARGPVFTIASADDLEGFKVWYAAHSSRPHMSF